MESKSKKPYLNVFLLKAMTSGTLKCYPTLPNKVNIKVYDKSQKHRTNIIFLLHVCAEGCRILRPGCCPI